MTASTVGGLACVAGVFFVLFWMSAIVCSQANLVDLRSPSIQYMMLSSVPEADAVVSSA